MCTVAAELPGFISAEVIAPVPSGQPLWRIIQHFRSDHQLHAWCQSDQHRRLLLEAESLVENNGTPGLLEEEASEPHEDGTVTEVVTTYVKPDKVEEYKKWAAKIHKVEAQFPGYRGGFLQPPTSASQSYWTTLVRFATPEQLDAWLSSSDRSRGAFAPDRSVRQGWRAVPQSAVDRQERPLQTGACCSANTRCAPDDSPRFAELPDSC